MKWLLEQWDFIILLDQYYDCFYWLKIAVIPPAEYIIWRLLVRFWRWRKNWLATLLLTVCLFGDNSITFYMTLNWQIEKEMHRYIMEELRQPEQVEHNYIYVTET